MAASRFTGLISFTLKGKFGDFQLTERLAVERTGGAGEHIAGAHVLVAEMKGAGMILQFGGQYGTRTFGRVCRLLAQLEGAGKRFAVCIQNRGGDFGYITGIAGFRFEFERAVGAHLQSADATGQINDTAGGMAGGLAVGGFYREGNQFVAGFGALPRVAGNTARVVADIMCRWQHIRRLRQLATGNHRLGSQSTVALLYHIVDHNRFGPIVACRH